MSKLFIPKIIKVGFQQRRDTFTGKLAYVIYFDEKNKLRKEKSWDGWRDHKIESFEYDNSPRSGYILNKGIQRYSDWGSSRAVTRIYDPRDFEFEISIDNLIGILTHSDVSKREITEECVFAWAGTELVLLPTTSVEYQESLIYTELQSDKVSTKDLVKGLQYKYKKSDGIATYIGQFDWYINKQTHDLGAGIIIPDFPLQQDQRLGPVTQQVKLGKRHVFKVGQSFELVSPSVLTRAISTEPVDNYAELVDDFFSTVNSQPIASARIDLDFWRDIDETTELTSWDFGGRLHKIDGDKITRTRFANYGYTIDTTRPITNVLPYVYQFVFKINGLLVKSPIQNVKQYSNSYYSYRTGSYSTDYIDIHNVAPLLQSIPQSAMLRNGKYNAKLFYEALSKVGFGKLKITLADGREIDINTTF